MAQRVLQSTVQGKSIAAAVVVVRSSSAFCCRTFRQRHHPQRTSLPLATAAGPSPDSPRPPPWPCGARGVCSDAIGAEPDAHGRSATPSNTNEVCYTDSSDSTRAAMEDDQPDDALGVCALGIAALSLGQTEGTSHANAEQDGGHTQQISHGEPQDPHDPAMQTRARKARNGIAPCSLPVLARVAWH